jgi:hypothetical protein
MDATDEWLLADGEALYTLGWPLLAAFKADCLMASFVTGGESASRNDSALIGARGVLPEPGSA